MKTAKPFDVQKHGAEAVRLYKQHVSIAEMKRKWHCYGNPIVAHLKKAGVYLGAVAVGKAAPKATTRKRTDVVSMRPNGITSKELVETISRGVAAAAFGNARFTPEPMTRTEMFEKIQAGVTESVKRMNIGFHS